MTVRFPDEPGFQGRFAPVRLEGEIRGVEVTQGEIPAALRGTYYRVGADPAWPPFVERDFYFNADGMVAMFRFGGGGCDFRSRYVRTPRFVAERAARRSLFGAYRNPYTDDPSVAGLSRGLANTNVYWHGGRLLASKEDSAPIQLDPDTLDTVGEFTWEGDLSSQTATAHPKIDPRTGELVFFGYMAKGEATRDIAYYEADATGRIVHEAWFEAPYSSMVHDWAVTENFVIFPIIPLTASPDRLKAGGPLYVWDGSADVYLGVVPRKGNAVRWYRGTNRFASHIMNAYDDGRHIHIDTPVGG
jgi:carotenoid cleavage dioxygenase-like enzyme